MSLAEELNKFNTTLPFLINTDNPPVAYSELKEFILTNWGANLDEYNPNMLVIRPENERISVDQIRTLKNFINQTSTDNFKLAIIYEIDKTNIYGANACLKLLEEASLDTKIFLISSNPHRLPITVRSRCYAIRHLSSEAMDETSYNRIILDLIGGNILKIIELFDLKADWVKFSVNCQNILNRLIKYKLNNLDNLSNHEIELFTKCQSDVDTLLKLFDEIKLLSNHASNYELDRKASALLILGIMHEHFSN